MNELGALMAIVGRWWQDPTITGLNRLPAHTLFSSYITAEDARAARNQRWTHDLSGEWEFQLVAEPEAAPDGWTTAQGSNLREVPVPGNWTMQDTGDHPHYTNVVMPFAAEPPSVPTANPTGLFRKQFSRPRGWAKRRTVLHIGGADSTAAVWCNGNFIGLATDSRLPSEFDLTNVLKATNNVIAIMVVRWSAGVWIEDQDHWHQAGLHRTVNLQSRGIVHLSDVRVTADFDHKTETGTLNVTASVTCGSNPKTSQSISLKPGWSISTSVERLNGRGVGTKPQSGQVSTFDSSSHGRAMFDAYRHPGPVATTQSVLANVRAWSDEDPFRYRVLVSLLNPEGHVLEVVPVLVGFRSVEINGPELLLNGQAQVLAGVNRHDHHPLNGKTLTAQENLDDVRQIKASGFNAVRTAHYPPDQALLDACDEVGLWVVCEGNVESHARWNEICNDQRFDHAVVERTQRMVRFHYNHPSIIGWSLGNEAGIGPAHDAAAAWVRSFDPSRFVQYEGGVMHRWALHAPASIDTMRQPLVSTDIECPMYPSIEALSSWGAEVAGTQHAKPLIMCEYSHAMGNSNGGLIDYWNLIRSTRGLQGGFIWDWRDQGLQLENDDGVTFFGYGGAFGETPNDAAFCCNGIVGSDAASHPAIEEHRWLTQPVTTDLGITAKKSGQNAGDILAVKVTNRRSFTDLSDLTLTINASRNGEPVWTRRVATPKVAPQQTNTVTLKLPKQVRQGRQGDEILLTACWTTKAASAWAPTGHEVAWDQTRLSVARPFLAREPRSSVADSARPKLTVIALPGPMTDVDQLVTAQKGTVSDEDTDFSGNVPIAVASVSAAENEVLLASNSDIALQIDTETGDLVSIVDPQYPNVELLVEGPTVSLWRAPLDNDGVLVGPGARLTGLTRKWLGWGLDQVTSTTTAVDVANDRQGLTVTVTRSLTTGSGIGIDHTQLIQLGPSGPARFLETIRIPETITDLPRIGVSLQLSQELQALRWLGLGPMETYPDRKAARRGLWSTTVAEQYVPYATPQHHGSHVDTIWAELSSHDENGAALRFGLDGQIFDVSAFSAEQLTKASTTDQLSDSNSVHLHLDHRLRGVGTAACGPDTTELVGPGEYQFRWSLAAVRH